MFNCSCAGLKNHEQSLREEKSREVRTTHLALRKGRGRCTGLEPSPSIKIYHTQSSLKTTSGELVRSACIMEPSRLNAGLTGHASVGLLAANRLEAEYNKTAVLTYAFRSSSVSLG